MPSALNCAQQFFEYAINGRLGERTFVDNSLRFSVTKPENVIRGNPGDTVAIPLILKKQKPSMTIFDRCFVGPNDRAA